MKRKAKLMRRRPVIYATAETCRRGRAGAGRMASRRVFPVSRGMGGCRRAACASESHTSPRPPTAHRRRSARRPARRHRRFDVGESRHSLFRPGTIAANSIDRLTVGWGNASASQGTGVSHGRRAGRPNADLLSRAVTRLMVCPTPVSALPSCGAFQPTSSCRAGDAARLHTLPDPCERDTATRRAAYLGTPGDRPAGSACRA